MKHINYKYLISLSLSLFIITSCSEDMMDKVNKDVNHTTDVSARYILTDVMTKAAFTGVGGDMNSYVSTYIEHEAGAHNQFWDAEMRNGEPSSQSTYNNLWNSMYYSIADVKTAIEKCSADGDESDNLVTLGIAQVMLAHNITLMTDMFGDIPFREAGNYKEHRIPSVDSQETIYQDVMALLDEAIDNLGQKDNVGIGAQDLIYGGKSANWIKAAYGLKARYTMRLSNRTTDIPTAMNNVLDYISKSFDSADEQFSFNIYSGSNWNPMFATFRSRYGVSASQSLYNKLKLRNDPRLSRTYINSSKEYFIPVNDEEINNMAPNGNVTQSQRVYNNSVFVACQSSSTHLLSYHELLFLKAEALYRLGQTANAKAALKDAVIAGLANTQYNINEALRSEYWNLTGYAGDITTTEAATYFDSSVAPLFDANPLKEIMIQKYLAMWGANGETVETYNDVRRMKAENNDFYELQNKLQFPLRCPYTGSETAANPAINALYGNGQYVYTENVWWAGGTR